MANLKKELKGLISRFDAAQEAFAANSTDVKKLTKAHKKAMKGLKAELKAARIEIEALKAELAIAKLGAPTKPVASSKPAAKRRGRPAGVKNKPAAKPAAKRGRPAGSKNKTAATKPVEKTTPAKPAAKRRGRPAGSKNKATAAKPVAKATAAKPAAKRGRPAGSKNKATAAKPVAKKTTGPKRSPGRPRTKPKTPASALEAINGVGPAMAKQFEAAGVKTPAQMAKLSNKKMAEILEKCGPRYRNATPAKMDAYRKAATAAK